MREQLAWMWAGIRTGSAQRKEKCVRGRMGREIEDKCTILVLWERFKKKRRVGNNARVRVPSEGERPSAGPPKLLLLAARRPPPAACPVRCF